MRDFFGAPPEEEIDQAFLQQYIDTQNLLYRPAAISAAREHPHERKVRLVPCVEQTSQHDLVLYEYFSLSVNPNFKCCMAKEK